MRVRCLLIAVVSVPVLVPATRSSAGVLAGFGPIPFEAFRVNGSINDPEGPDDSQNVNVGQVTPIFADGGGTTSTGPVRGSAVFSAAITGGAGLTHIDLDAVADCERPAGNRSFVTIGIFPNGDDAFDFAFNTSIPLLWSVTNNGSGNQSVHFVRLDGDALENPLLPGDYRIDFFVNASLQSYFPEDTPTPDTSAAVIDWRLTLRPVPAPGTGLLFCALAITGARRRR